MIIQLTQAFYTFKLFRYRGIIHNVQTQSHSQKKFLLVISYGSDPLLELKHFIKRKSPGPFDRATLPGGGRGIRTLEGLHPTRFPSVRHRPLGDPSIFFII